MKNVFYNLDLMIRYLKYKRRYGKKVKALGFVPDIRSTEETLNMILRERCSVSRYGDGEFNVIRERGNGFCHYNPKLAERVREVLDVEVPNHVVCLPHVLVSHENINFRTKVFWLSFFVKAYEVLSRHLREDYVYYDASFTRFYFAYKNKNVCKGYLEGIKRIWEGRDVLLVEGEYSRLGVNNDLFANAGEVRRVLAPAEDAFERYDAILEAAMEHGRGRLILLALGQTATVLAYDLAKEGFWAIDIGHVDVEYEWYLRGAKDKIKIAGKYVQEAHDRREDMGEIQDESYLKQIVCRV